MIGMVPLVYLSSMKEGIMPQQKPHPLDKNKTSVLKLVRNLEDDYSEFFEFSSLDEYDAGSTVLGFRV